MHRNDPSLTQNQGNYLGDRPAVRLANHDHGAGAKAAMGWGGAGSGIDHKRPGEQPRQQAPASQPPQQAPQQQQQTRQNTPPYEGNPNFRGRPGAGQANRTTYNFMTGQ